jgi:hypothetical protein
LVAKDELLLLQVPPPSMPTLEGDAKAAYELVHANNSLRSYEDPKGVGHGGQIMGKEFDELESATGTNSLKGRYFHKPRHDVESVFWVIVAFLLRARPIDTTEDAGEESSGTVVKDEKHTKNKEDGGNDVTKQRDEDGDWNVDGDQDEDEDGDRDREDKGGDEEHAANQKLDLVC